MGEKAKHVVAFSREHEGRTVIAAVPILCGSLLGKASDTVCNEMIWGDTTVAISNPAAPCYHNVFTGECVQPSVKPNDDTRSPLKAGNLSAGKLFRDFPVALLTSESVGGD
jgi:(1->4)-alpha-D-glucan 1-alpha-D-glucosylmutase